LDGSVDQEPALRVLLGLWRVHRVEPGFQLRMRLRGGGFDRVLNGIRVGRAVGGKMNTVGRLIGWRRRLVRGRFSGAGTGRLARRVRLGESVGMRLSGVGCRGHRERVRRRRFRGLVERECLEKAFSHGSRHFEVKSGIWSCLGLGLRVGIGLSPGLGVRPFSGRVRHNGLPRG
jgi:hypothetical protein